MTQVLVKNMRSPRTGNEVANQFVIHLDKGNTVVFQSYSSQIVTIDHKNHTLTFGEDWDYSVTTGKYRNEFLSEFGFYKLANAKAVRTLKEGDIVDGYTVHFA